MITAVNVAAAALLSQFSLGIILAVCAYLLKADFDSVSWQDRRYNEERAYGRMPWVIIVVSLLTTGVLFLSEPYSNFWRPLFGDLEVVKISSSQALLLVFLIDIFSVFYLASRTGGSHSPFAAVYFVLPPLAIFLREEVWRIVLYVVLVAILFTWGMFQDTGRPPSSRRRGAYWFVSVASFALATVIGIVTRPK